MSYHIRITARAQADVDATLTWLGDRSPQVAARWHAALRAKVQTLEARPERYPRAFEADSLGIDMREMLVGKRRGIYRILYTIDGDIVHMLHIRHAARDWLRPEDI